MSPREPQLAGQTVAVIGGSSGIGLETARLVRAEGADVILTGRHRERLERAARETATLPIRRVVGPADVASMAVHLMASTAVTGATCDVDGGEHPCLQRSAVTGGRPLRPGGSRE